VREDLAQFFHREHIPVLSDADKHLRFPNYTHRVFCDGSLMHIGNAASFLEPLESTAIHVICTQLDAASVFLARWQAQEHRAANLQVLNRYLAKNVQGLSLVMGWHYAMGAPYDTDFRHFARANFAQEYPKVFDTDLLDEFDRYLDAGERFGGAPSPSFAWRVGWIRSCRQRCGTGCCACPRRSSAAFPPAT